MPDSEIDRRVPLVSTPVGATPLDLVWYVQHQRAATMLALAGEVERAIDALRQWDFDNGTSPLFRLAVEWRRLAQEE